MNHSAVAFMPIRLNSQRIKNKSIINILGRPMFCWSLQTLDQLDIPVYVYTNNEEQLRKELDFRTENVSFLERPSRLDNHSVKGIEIYKEFSKQIKSEVYMLTHCTSPFVKKDTYEKALDAVLSENYDSSCTVEKKQTFSWHKGQPINFSIPRKKTQEISPVYIETSAVYCYTSEVLKMGSRSGKNHKFIISKGLENVDIDETDDLEIFQKRKQIKW